MPTPLAVTTAELVRYLGEAAAVAAVAFIVLTVLASTMRFQHLAALAEEPRGDGVDPENAFHLQIANRIGSVKHPHPSFCLLLFALDDEKELGERRQEGIASDVIEHLERELRAGLRRGSDWVQRYEEENVAVILAADREHGSGVVARVLQQLREAPHRTTSGAVLPVTARAGIATYPENGRRVQTLVEKLELALGRTGESGAEEKWVMAPAPVRARDATEPELEDEAEGDEEEEDEEVASARSAVVDELTGVMRKERMWSALQKYVARYRKEADPVSIILLDVDHLRRYNEHYGEAAGDEILRGLGALLQRAVREDDLIIRSGGEEFVLCLGCDPKQAHRVMKRVATDVKRSSFRFEGMNLKISVSAGVAGFPDHGGAPRKLMAFAHAALYAAKDKGRNVCMVYQAHMEQPDTEERPLDVF